MRRTVISSLSLLSGMLLAACSDATGPSDPLALLAQNMTFWEQQGVPSYQFTIRRVCECIPEQMGPVVVEVRNGTVHQRRYETGTAVSPQFDDLFRPVPGLFELIRDAIQFPAAAIAVRYDRSYGFPESIQIDWVAGEVDDEVSYQISDFTPLP